MVNKTDYDRKTKKDINKRKWRCRNVKMVDIFRLGISSTAPMDEELNLKTSFRKFSQACLIICDNHIARIYEYLFEIHTFGFVDEMVSTAKSISNVFRT